MKVFLVFLVGIAFCLGWVYQSGIIHFSMTASLFSFVLLRRINPVGIRVLVGFIVAAVIVVVLYVWWGLLALIPGWVAVFLVLWYVFRNAEELFDALGKKKEVN